jgi:poly(3-hydroxybutyrate) depolymerase
LILFVILTAAALDAGVVFAISSDGCSLSEGESSIFSTAKVGDCVELTLEVDYGIRSYHLCLPSTYTTNSNDGDSTKAFPIILNFHGWGTPSSVDIGQAGVWDAVQAEGAEPAIVVHPQGYADNTKPSVWYSWHVNGTSESPGPAGPTCTQVGGTSFYCYESCKDSDTGNCDELGCDWTTCVDDYEFITALLDLLEQQMCIETSREYATGCSNGGMMAYGLGANLQQRFAAVAPQCGSFHNGFLDAPDAEVGIGMPLMDIHGNADVTVPINMTRFNKDGDKYPLSADGWYYTQINDITDAWRISNNCTGDVTHYSTSLDGVDGLYCIAEGSCIGGDVVRCAWEGGHDYYGGSYNINSGKLVWEFLQQWNRPCHIGGGEVDTSSCLSTVNWRFVVSDVIGGKDVVTLTELSFVNADGETMALGETPIVSPGITNGKGLESYLADGLPDADQQANCNPLPCTFQYKLTSTPAAFQMGYADSTERLPSFLTIQFQKYEAAEWTTVYASEPEAPCGDLKDGQVCDKLSYEQINAETFETDQNLPLLSTDAPCTWWNCS